MQSSGLNAGRPSVAADQRRKTVATRHPAYLAMCHKWMRCRDAAAGQDDRRFN